LVLVLVRVAGIVVAGVWPGCVALAALVAEVCAGGDAVATLVALTVVCGVDDGMVVSVEAAPTWVVCAEAGGVAEGMGCANMAVMVANLAFRAASSNSSSDRISMSMDRLIFGLR
jgi:hypothetical protein